jgi:hypothetical protein
MKMADVAHQLLLAAVVGASLPTIVHAAPQIEWEVANRFRAFDYLGEDDTEDRKLGVERFESYRVRPEDVSMQGWAARVLRQGSPYSNGNSGPWRERRGKANPGYDQNFVELPERMIVRVRLTDDGRVVAGACVWSIDGAAQDPRPCSDASTIDIKASGSQVAVVLDGGAPLAMDVRPKLRIVVGFGDSYAAGEGSPDRPTSWKKRTKPGKSWQLMSRSEINGFVDQPAGWMSPRCNRSFWSSQHMLALRMASDDPHSVVSFVHLACAGAEVVDGLLAPQRMAPGHPRGCKHDPKATDVDVRCDVPQSQVAAAVDLLCRRPTRKILSGAPELVDVLAPLQKLNYARDQVGWVEASVCPPGEMRSIETVLLGVGGNDMGFYGVIAWGLAPIKSRHPLFHGVLDALYGLGRNKVSAVCPRHESYGGAKEACRNPAKLTAQERMGELTARYDALRIAMGRFLGVSGSQVILGQYPNPMASSTGLCANPPRSTDNNQWSAIYLGRDLPLWLFGKPNPLQVNLTEYEANEVNRYVVPRLAEVMSDYAVSVGWKTAATSGSMSARGWCVGGSGPLMPPSQASRWNGLADTGRRIRTLNDAFLSQWPGQEDRDDGMSGGLHPNVQGYAAMADAMVESLLKVEK